MRFVAPDGVSQVSKESDVYRAEDGVIDCPASVGLELGLSKVQDVAPARTSGAGETGIATVNADKAKGLVEAAESIEALSALENAEHTRKDGPRSSVLRAIDHKRAALAGSGN